MGKAIRSRRHQIGRYPQLSGHRSFETIGAIGRAPTSRTTRWAKRPTEMPSDALGRIIDAIERRRHPADHRVPNPALDVLDNLSSCALVRAPIEALGREPELHEQVTRIIRRLCLTPLLLPKPEEGGLVAPHDNPCVRATEERAALDRLASFHCIWLHLQNLNVLWR